MEDCKISYFLSPEILNPKRKRRKLIFDDIVRYVCEQYQIPIDQIFMKTRKIEYKDARQIIHYLSRKHLNITLQKLADKSNFKTHSNIIQAIRRIKNLITIEEDLEKKVSKIEYKIMLRL